LIIAKSLRNEEFTRSSDLAVKYPKGVPEKTRSPGGLFRMRFRAISSAFRISSALASFSFCSVASALRRSAEGQTANFLTVLSSFDLLKLDLKTQFGRFNKSAQLSQSTSKT